MEFEVPEIPLNQVEYLLDKSKKPIILGVGGYGKVFLCYWKLPQMKVAMKVISINVKIKSVEKSIKREIQAANSLKHPTVVKIYGMVTVSTHEVGILMEFLEDGSIWNYITENPKKSLTYFEKWMIIENIVRSVQYLHSKKYLHRDLKPENILFSKKKKIIKICDFGFSTTKSSSTTSQSGFMGSIRYVASEIFSSMKYGIKSDIYALGCTIYAIIEEKEPFYHIKNTFLLHTHVLKGEKPSISENVPNEFRHLVILCTMKDPAARPTATKILEFMKQKEKN